MPQTVPNATQPNVSYSGTVDQLLIEKFNGKVKAQYIKGENLMRFQTVEEAKGTNTITEKYIGETELQVLNPGVAPEPKQTELDKNSVVVDTVVIARNATHLLDDVQSDIDSLKSKLVTNQVKQLKKMEDTMIVQQMIYGATQNFLSTDAGTTGRVNPRVPGHGYSSKLTISDVQSLVPNKLLASIEQLIENMEEWEIDFDELKILVDKEMFGVLSDAQQIVNGTYLTATDNKVDGLLLKRFMLPIMKTYRMPTVLSSSTDRGHHELSNANNAYRYDVIAAQLAAKVVVFGPEALLVGSSIKIDSLIWWSDNSKSFIMDSWLAEGAIPGRWEQVGVVFGGGSTNTDIDTRAARKAVVTTT